LSSDKQTFMDHVISRRSACRLRIRNVVTVTVTVSWYQNVSILDFTGAKDDIGGGDR